MSDAAEAQKQKVLVIDDEEGLCLALQRDLSKLGAEVSYETNAGEGLRRVIAEKPEVLLVDLRMPEIDGHEVLRRLALENVNTAVIAVSGAADMADLVALFREGAVDFVKKPWTQAELHAAVNRAFEIQRKRAPLYVEVADEAPGTGAASSTEVFLEVLTRIRKGRLRLPAVPSVITDLRAKLVSSNARMDDIVALVQRDQMLSTDVLRMATSALYGNLKGKPDLRTAITRVGFREMLNLVDTVMAARFFRIEDAAFRPIVVELWRMSLARAMCMRALAEAAGTRAATLTGERAYLAGLLADTGASFLVRVLVELPPARRPSSVEACVAFVASHHEQIGESLLGSWGIDGTVSKVAGTHHRARVEDIEPYWSLTVVGSELACRILGVTDPLAHATRGPEEIEAAAANLALKPEALEAVKQKVEGPINAAIAALA